MGDAQRGVLVRDAAAAGAGAGAAGAREPRHRLRLTPDGAIVPALLLLVARDLLLHDPPRVLAWRLLHDPRLQHDSGLLRFLAPAGNPFDRDPVALALAAVASVLALAYLGAALAGARVRIRAALVAAAAIALLVVPTAAFVALGQATGRPYGQDGGVVQLPLAIDRILAGDSPYAADYSGTILGRQARASEFWSRHGGNPILRHHAYLPGIHLLMLPAHVASRAALGAFDPRLVTLPGCLLAAWLAAVLARRGERGVAAAALVVANPLVYWQQVFGANDVLVAAVVLGAVAAADRRRPYLSAGLLGLACAAKQLAWPFAPFLIAHWSGARSLGELTTHGALSRSARPTLLAVGVFAGVVAPVAALDFAAFWSDIVAYNVGLPGGDSYPLGGTPGFGLANYLIYFGRVSSLADHVSFGPLYALLAPLGVLLVRAQLRSGRAAMVLVTGSAALVASVYVSRVVHPNYLILAAVLLPVGFLAGARVPVDTVVAPLLLLSWAVELAEREPFRAVWDDAVAVRLPQHVVGLGGWLAPRAGPDLTLDPVGLLLSATAAGLGVVWLAAGVAGAGCRFRAGLGVAALATVVVAPAVTVVRIGTASGQARVQDPWAAAAVDAARTSLGHSRALAPREAWSASFRRDPARAFESDRGVAPLSAGLWGRASAALGLADPRGLGLVALLAALVLFAGAVSRHARGWAPAVIGLAPVTAVAVAFGGPEPPLLALAAGTAGLSAAAPRLERGAWLTLVVAALAVWARATPEPGLGVTNLALYAGLAPPPVVAAVLAGLGWAAAVFTVWRAPGPAGAATALVAGLWLQGGATPHAVLLPLALLVVSAASQAPGTDA